ncbi:DUF2975 domain-containing protein [Leucobacter sp. wl10]|uniref:DUF2975 domain-containing protein n=1 Tax=Leucobacter sp. wl10 TaxID=2304677 RepID=UPI000E5A3BBC|nr:DUF2975 domain-containing protein [Leucobacter sp. wl10]RGE21492.1 DUF2975 domain-containing protein [Leucobacter sp. wl10]
MHRATILTLQGLITVLLVLLLGLQVLVVGGLFFGLAGDPGLPTGADVLLGVCVVGFVLCAQAILVCVWRLATLAAAARIFDPSAFSWVHAALAATVAAAAFALTATVAVSALQGGVPPVVGVGGVFVTLLCLGLALVIVVMRALLRQAAQLERELAEVV